MKSLLRSVLLLFLLSLSIKAKADYDFSTGGLYYKIVSMQGLTCSVVGGDDVDNLVIPNVISFRGKELKVVRIESSAFRGNNIKSLVVGRFVEVIEEYAFEDCDYLDEVVLSEGIITIKYRAFYGCRRLSKIVIPSTCMLIGGHAFDNGYILDGKIVVIEESDVPITIGEAGLGCGGENSFAFIYRPVSNPDVYHSYRTVHLEKNAPACSTSSISYWWDNRVSLNTLRLGSGIKSLGDMRGVDFDENSFLLVYSSEPPKAVAFNNKTLINTTLVVPKGCVEKYRSAPVWKDFWVIEELSDQVDTVDYIDILDGNIQINDMFMNPDDHTVYEIMDFKEAEEVAEEEVEDEAINFMLVEEKPKFNGGDSNEFSKWIGEHLEYPEIAKENGVDGKVTVQFTVEKDGRVTNVKVVRGVDPALDQEAVRVVKSSPRWTPGRQRDKAVRVTYTFPVVFQLR